MKKFLFGILLTMISIMVAGCQSCQSDNKQEDLVEPVEIIAEDAISMDKEYMLLTYGDEYVWYETDIKLKNYLDEECDGVIESLANVFQINYSDKDSEVVTITHTSDGETYTDVKQGFWVEDFILKSDEIALTYKEAFEKVNEVNSPKPHTKNCFLRKPVGPKECNPQWCFGNINSQLWVDAVTGEVKDSNPAF